MTKKTHAQVISASPEAIIYKRVKLPREVPAGDSLSEELSKLILLEAQGEAVEISEEYPLPILMAAFHALHKVSPEMVLELKSGKRVLLFEHWGQQVLRDKDIIVIGETKTTAHKADEKSEGFVAELIIDLEKIWNKTSAEENDLEAVKKILKEIEKSVKPSMVTTFTGKAPVLICLLAQHLLYGRTGEIWYQENSGSKPIRIARL